jgi:small subunit ribosomal protein S16
MALKIRLSRGGSKKRPFYRIVVAEAAAPRDGRYVERIGHYNPMVAKDNDQRLVIDGERVKHWIGLGAKPTERVQKLLSTLSLTAPVEMRDQPKKSAPGKKRAEREAEEAAAAEAAAAEAAEAAAAAAEAPAEEAPAEEATAEVEAPAEEAPAEEATAEAEAPAEETPAEEAPAEEVAAEEEKPADA